MPEENPNKGKGPTVTVKDSNGAPSTSKDAPSASQPSVHYTKPTIKSIADASAGEFASVTGSELPSRNHGGPSSQGRQPGPQGEEIRDDVSQVSGSTASSREIGEGSQYGDEDERRRLADAQAQNGTAQAAPSSSSSGNSGPSGSGGGSQGGGSDSKWDKWMMWAAFAILAFAVAGPIGLVFVAGAYAGVKAVEKFGQGGGGQGNSSGGGSGGQNQSGGDARDNSQSRSQNAPGHENAQSNGVGGQNNGYGGQNNGVGDQNSSYNQSKVRKVAGFIGGGIGAVVGLAAGAVAYSITAAAIPFVGPVVGVPVAMAAGYGAYKATTAAVDRVTGFVYRQGERFGNYLAGRQQTRSQEVQQDTPDIYRENEIVQGKNPMHQQQATNQSATPSLRDSLPKGEAQNSVVPSSAVAVSFITKGDGSRQ